MRRPLVLIFCVTLVHVVGILLFCGGFLLSRPALNRVNECTQNPCTLPATHKRAVLLVIDGLRFDFMSPNPPAPHSPFRHNVLTLPRELAERYPDRSFLFDSAVDPPTTTLLRIKGITTGSLSTFADISSNFGGSAIDEDSLIVQLNRAGRKIAFAGDDSWITVYPTAFNMSHPFDSFNCEDLHTVDSGVVEHIFPLLQPGAPDWDFAIGHFLGVDHVGHRVGPDHLLMRDKLVQMNTVLQSVVDALDDDTLLIVMGDHGIDEKGDHGGYSARERSAALWIHSKSIPLSTASPPAYLSPSARYVRSSHEHRLVQQIDLVPSLALLLGLPIPFNNLGTVIPELFGDRLDAALEVNARQVWAFLQEYRASASGDELDHTWDTLSSAWATAKGSQQRVKFTRLALEVCRAVWAPFNMRLMLAGLAVLCLGVLLVFILLMRQSDVNYQEISIACGMGGLGAAAVALFFDLKDMSRVNTTLVIAAGMFCLVLIFSSVQSGGASFSLSWSAVPLFLHSASLISISSIVREERVLLFLLISTVAPTIFNAFRSPTPRLRNRAFEYLSVLAITARLIGVSVVCREEQEPYCTPTYYAAAGTHAPPWTAIFLAPMCAVLLPGIVQRALAFRENDRGPMRFILSVIVRGALIIGTVCWLLENIETSRQDAPRWIRPLRTVLARVSLITTVIGGGAIWIVNPLCLDVSRGQGQDGNGVRIIGLANAIGASYLLFVVLIGLVPMWTATELSGHIVLLLAFVGLLSWLEVIASSREISNARIWAPKATQTLSDRKSSSEISLPAACSVAGVRFDEVAVVALLAQITFFGTGHQATLQSLQWKTAFVLSRTLVYPWSPLTLAISSLGSLVVIGGMGAVLVGVWCSSPQGLVKIERNVVRSALAVTLYFSSLLLGSALSSAIHRRHPMVWTVFAPRLLLACATLLAVDFGALLSLGVGIPVIMHKIREVLKDVSGALEE